MKQIFYKIKRWIIIKYADSPRIGDVVCYYPMSQSDSFRQKIVIHKYRNYSIFYKTIFPEYDISLSEMDIDFFKDNFVLEKYVTNIYINS